ncbi:MAG TPA: DUF2306 domain-containing protein [Candidatus Xenobia bacterium]|jgi:uncharacterized membrane protein
MRALRVAGGLCVAYVSVGIALASFGYVTGSPTMYDVLFRYKYVAHLGVVWLHGVGGTVALAVGPFQFWPWLRTRWPRLHRTFGMVYLLAVGCAGLFGLDMALDAYGGAPACAAFVTQDVLWLATAWLAWSTVRRRQFAHHREWMFRNFALTFGAATARLYLAWLQGRGLDFLAIYPYVTWLSWVPNVLLVEVCLRGHPGSPRKYQRGGRQ